MGQTHAFGRLRLGQAAGVDQRADLGDQLGLQQVRLGVGQADGTYRSVYTGKLKGAVYVLHVFQKKSKRGIATPQSELALIRQRLKDATSDAKGTTP